jgi:short-subunit dehydrogenase involved in D-alanine esterification of teichoic acids
MHPQTAYIHLTTHLTPYLLSTPSSPKPVKSYLIITSCLGLVPLARCPVYCATKAALHMFILGLRQQMKDTNLEILECLPPTVEVCAAFSFVGSLV